MKRVSFMKFFLCFVFYAEKSVDSLQIIISYFLVWSKNDLVILRDQLAELLSISHRSDPHGLLMVYRVVYQTLSSTHSSGFHFLQLYIFYFNIAFVYIDKCFTKTVFLGHWCASSRSYGDRDFTI